MTALQNISQKILAKSGLSKLEKREKIIVLAGILLLAGLGLFHFAISPLLNAHQQTQKTLVQRKEDIKQIRQLQKEYRQLQNEAVDIEKKLQKRSPTFTLFAFVEERATNANVKQQIRSMTPSISEGIGALEESRVDLKLEQLSLQQLVDFLQQIESPDDVIAIKRISIQENTKEEGTLDVVLQITTFSQKS